MSELPTVTHAAVSCGRVTCACSLGFAGSPAGSSAVARAPKICRSRRSLTRPSTVSTRAARPSSSVRHADIPARSRHSGTRAGACASRVRCKSSISPSPDFARSRAGAGPFAARFDPRSARRPRKTSCGGSSGPGSTARSFRSGRRRRRRCSWLTFGGDDERMESVPTARRCGCR